MNRERLADEAPSWLAMETFAAHAKSVMLVRWIESILDAIEQDHGEPDNWEALYLTYAVGALVESQYVAALKFTGMSLADPAKHPGPRLPTDGPGPVSLTELRAAVALIKAGPSAAWGPAMVGTKRRVPYGAGTATRFAGTICAW